MWSGFGLQGSELVLRQLRHMQELRDFEKGIVLRAEEILVSGQDSGVGGKHLSLGGGRQSRKNLLGGGGSGNSVGPVARPVMRVQGSRNILRLGVDGAEDSDGESDGGSSDAATPAPGRALGKGRGFGRGPPKSKLLPRPAPRTTQGDGHNALKDTTQVQDSHQRAGAFSVKGDEGNNTFDNILSVRFCVLVVYRFMRACRRNLQ